MGECVAPYVALDPLKAALPVHRSTMTMPLNHDDCEGNRHNACQLETEELHDSMRRRWERASEMYRKAHDGQAVQDLYQRLNHQKTLTSQLDYLQGAITDDEAIRIAYTSAGRPTATIIRGQSRRTRKRAVPNGMPIRVRVLLPDCHHQQRRTREASETTLPD